MSAPTVSWNLVRLHGTWRGQNGALKAGSYKVTIPARITNHTNDVIVPAGIFAAGELQTINDAAPSLDLMVPATDDPDNDQTNWEMIVEVTFPDAANERYSITVPVADRPVIDGGTGLGVNLRTVVLPTTIPPAEPMYRVGVPGGLAQLNENGDVIDADGDVITGGGGGGAELTSYVDQVESLTDYPTSFPADWDSITDRPTSFPAAWDSITGRPAVIAAGADAATARSVIGAQQTGNYATLEDLDAAGANNLHVWRTGEADPTGGGSIELAAGTWMIVLGTADSVPVWVPVGSIIVRSA